MSGEGALPDAACAIAVMAKAPQPGLVKTRLVPPLTPEAAGLLSRSFLSDITENIRRAAAARPIAGYIAYAPAGGEALFDGLLAPGTRLVLADGSGAMPPGVQGFGRALFHAAQALFARGHRAACLLNSDGPTLPTALLSQAAEALAAPGERVVLGPAEDGGYYLLGMKAPHPHLFADIPWSTAGVAEETRRRARALGLDIVELAPWYDVDDGAALRRLWREVSAPPPAHGLAPYPAPVTAACLARLRLDDEVLGAAAD
jgi:rSAM/selenodomain-associated transferase 1